MVFDGENATTSSACARDERLLVNGLHGEDVDDPDVDSCCLQSFGRHHGVVQRDATCHNCHLIAVTLDDHLKNKMAAVNENTVDRTT